LKDGDAMRIVTVIGARPQFIKAAVVSREFSRAGIEERIIHTGQHFDKNMSEVFFTELGIPEPQVNLGIGGSTHGQNTGRMIEGIEAELTSVQPDFLLVYGDTDSTLAGALAAVKLHIPVVHVEAGLRSFNRRMPEEINRILTDHAADLLLAPTELAMAHLSGEGVPAERCFLVGDVMFDAAIYYGKLAAETSGVLRDNGLDAGNYILATVHRAENTDVREHLESIFKGFESAPLPVVVPLHPRTKARMRSFNINAPDNVILIDPVGYLDMVMLEKNAALIATDSGGVQKEAFFHGIPCVTLRSETEWVELVDHGWNRLAPPSTEADLGSVIREAIDSKGKDVEPYGRGNSAQLIVQILKSE
jgi:UDP-GlcNAc3NAcA epimerase